MKTLFTDNVKSNSNIRESNIKLLKENGFIEGGIFSHSGEMYFRELKTKSQLVFGMRCNVSGKRNKYFSLSKDFTDQSKAIEFFNVIRLYLQTKQLTTEEINEDTARYAAHC